MRIPLAALCLAIAGCSTTQVYQNPGATFAPTTADRVAVFYSAPQRAHEVLGVVSATRWKPGFTDPSVSDALPQLRQAAAQLGADGVVVRASRSNNDRHTVVEAEAIRFTDRPADATPAPSPAQPASDCVACKKIGGG